MLTLRMTQTMLKDQPNVYKTKLQLLYFSLKYFKAALNEASSYNGRVIYGILQRRNSYVSVQQTSICCHYAFRFSIKQEMSNTDGQSSLFEGPRPRWLKLAHFTTSQLYWLFYGLSIALYLKKYSNESSSRVQ